MKPSKPVSKTLIKILISQIGVILFFISFIPIYTYFGTYFIKKVCLYDKCYLLPKHWIILDQVKNHKRTYLGINATSSADEQIENFLFLRTNSSKAFVKKVDYNIIENKDYFQKLKYVYKKKNDCIYWSRIYTIDEEKSVTIFFEKEKLEVSIHGKEAKETSVIIDTFCNPI